MIVGSKSVVNIYIDKVNVAKEKIDFATNLPEGTTVTEYCN